MLNFVKSAFRSWLEAFLWLNLISSFIMGAYYGNLIGSVSDKGGFGIIIGLIVGGIVGIVSNILMGGFIATIINIDDNLEKRLWEISSDVDDIQKRLQKMGSTSTDNNVDKENNEVPKKETALSGDFLK